MSPKFQSVFLKLSALILIFLALIGCKETAKKPAWTKSKVITAKLDHPSAMAFDDKFVYFVTGGTIASMNEGTNNIMKMPLEGGAPSVLFKGGDKFLPDTFVILLDDKFVYWIAGARLMRVPKDGGQFEIISEKFGMMVDVESDADNYYAISFGGENSPPAPIYSMNKMGGESAPITDPRPGANGLCIDNEFIYWVESDGIFKMNKSSREISKVYSPPKGFRTGKLKMDAENFYFTQAKSHGVLMRLSKKGGDAVQLADSINTAKEFEIDENNVYFTDNGGIGDVDYYLCKVSKNGGETVKLDGGYLNRFAVGKTHIYFNDVAFIYSIPK